tara:strand:- start:119 stop:433 length:315 start_codon:yes stop_codon:yes gene_type:complete
MQIHLKEADLKTAVKDFIAKMGVSRPVGTIEFTATRGADGVLTTVELSQDSSISAIGSRNPVQIAEPSVSADDIGSLLQEIAEKPETDDSAESSEDVSAKSLFS